MQTERIYCKIKNRIDIQTGYQCSAFSVAYLLRHYGIDALTEQIFIIKMPFRCICTRWLSTTTRTWSRSTTLQYGRRIRHHRRDQGPQGQAAQGHLRVDLRRIAVGLHVPAVRSGRHA